LTSLIADTLPAGARTPISAEGTETGDPVIVSDHRQLSGTSGQRGGQERAGND